ncbi:MAG: hypothetical protein AAFU59_13990 [Pseudomonadota bacterium]
MPNFDTGHYFLTALVPIRDGMTTDAGGVEVTFIQNLRATLAVLPTALQSPATEMIGINSPFARDRSTHFARLVVLDDVIFNGREKSDPILGRIEGKDPITPEPLDELNCAYLVFTADFDAVLAEGDPLPKTLDLPAQNRARDAWANRIWEKMQEELTDVFSNCEGFDEVSDGDDFARYLKRHQVETTMPFNDYWLTMPKFSDLPLLPILGAVAVPLVLALVALATLLLGGDELPWLGWSAAGSVWVGGILTVILAIAAVRWINTNGQKPLPPGQYADLPGVLKSLYLQKTFTTFAIDQQGASYEELHDAFGAFLDEHKPLDASGPTQAPGVISIGRPGGIVAGEG